MCVFKMHLMLLLWNVGASCEGVNDLQLQESTEISRTVWT